MHTFMSYFTAAFIFWTGALCASHENLALSSSGTKVPTSSGGSDYHQAKKDYHTGLHVRVTKALQHQNQQKSLDSRESLYPVRDHIERKIEKHHKELMNLTNGDKLPGPKNAQQHLSKQSSNYRINHPSNFWSTKPLTAKGDIHFHSYKANYHQDLLDRSMNAYTKQVAKGSIVPNENIDNDHQGMLPVARHFGRKVEKHKSQEMQIKSQSISPGPKNLQSIRTPTSVHINDVHDAHVNVQMVHDTNQQSRISMHGGQTSADGTVQKDSHDKGPTELGESSKETTKGTLNYHRTKKLYHQIAKEGFDDELNASIHGSNVELQDPQHPRNKFLQSKILEHKGGFAKHKAIIRDLKDNKKLPGKKNMQHLRDKGKMPPGYH